MKKRNKPNFYNKKSSTTIKETVSLNPSSSVSSGKLKVGKNGEII
jgi:hypothetical protein